MAQLINRKCSVCAVIGLIWIIVIASVSLSFAATPQKEEGLEMVGEGTAVMTKDADREVVRAVARFEACRRVVESAGRYFSGMRLIAYYEHQKEEIFCMTAHMLQPESVSESWHPKGDVQECRIEIHTTITPSDFIRADELDIKLDTQEKNASLREEMEPGITKKVQPGREIAKAYRLIRENNWRMAIIYLDRLTEKYPGWGRIHLARALAFYALNKPEHMKSALEKACRLGSGDACEDLKGFGSQSP